MKTRTKLAEDRVRKHTNVADNQRIDTESERRIQYFARADKDEIDKRLQELDEEWDIERILQTNASSLALAGAVLGGLVSRKWFLLPVLVGGFLLQHAVDGWCPPLVPLRKLGVRTRKEIEKERYALKVLRGDLEGLDGTSSASVTQLWAAIER